MNDSLQVRLFAGRALRAVREQEDAARAIRPKPDLPSQRSAEEPAATARPQALAEELM